MIPARLLARLCAAAASLLLAAVVADTAAAADKLGIAVPYHPEQINPLDVTDPVSRIVLANISSPLLLLGPGGRLLLGAAQNASSADGGELWRVTLRPELRFPSLMRVSSADIIRSFSFLQRLAAGQPGPWPRHLHAQSSPAFLSGWAAIVEVSAHNTPGKDAGMPAEEIVFRLRTPNPDFASFLALCPIIDPEVAVIFGEDYASGTNLSLVGAYQIRESRPDKGVTLERAPEFYEPGKPLAAVIELRSFSSAEDALRALRVGGIDIIALPTPAQLEQLSDDPTLTVLPSPLGNMSRLSGAWLLPRPYWSQQGDASDLLRTDVIIIRKSLQLDEAARSRFDLSGSFLP